MMQKRSVVFSVILIMIFIIYIANEDNTNILNIELKSNDTNIMMDEKSLRQSYRRVVSSQPYSDEILMDLIGPERICSLSKQADEEVFSQIYDKRHLVLGRTEHSLEYLLKINSDLIVTNSDSNGDFVRGIKDIGIPVYLYKTPKNIADIKDLILDLGVVLNAEIRAQNIVNDFMYKLELIKHKIAVKKHKKQRVIVYFTKGIFKTKNRPLHEALEILGLQDATDELNLGQYELISKETMIQLNPDIIIIMDWTNEGIHHTGTQRVKEMLEDESSKAVNAIKNGKVISIPIKHVLCFSHYLPDGISTMYRYIYDEEL